MTYIIRLFFYVYIIFNMNLFSIALETHIYESNYLNSSTISLSKESTVLPSILPTKKPITKKSSKAPSILPTKKPLTKKSSKSPTISPSIIPTKKPLTKKSSKAPITLLSINPSTSPTIVPTIFLTQKPTNIPVIYPSFRPFKSVEPPIRPRTLFPTKNPIKI